MSFEQMGAIYAIAILSAVWGFAMGYCMRGMDDE